MEELKPFEGKLLPCPFCGSNGRIRFDDLDNHYTVDCSQCDCGLQYGYSEKRVAISLWNTRPERKLDVGKVEITLLRARQNWTSYDVDKCLVSYAQAQAICEAHSKGEL